MPCDVENVYLNVPWQEMIWFAAGLEHGLEKKGKVMVRSLHGSNSSGTSWRKMFAETLRNMDFVPMVADSDFIVDE